MHDSTPIPFRDGAFRLVSSPLKHTLQVDVITWGGPHDMLELWRHVRSWRQPPSRDRLEAAMEKALANPRFFRKCKHCQGTTPTGYFMTGLGCCMPCGEVHHDILF